MKWPVLLLLPLTLAACKEEVANRPEPVAMTREAIGYYCQMDLLEHPGPKAQVHLDGLENPIFFSQVRDAIAYQRMPEQSHAITAVYVNDMAAAASWDQPGAENWIDATAAHYVIGSDATGGMEAPELVPFLHAKDAGAFAAQHGGRVIRLTEVADADVLSAVPIVTISENDRAEEDDFEARLKKLSHKRQN